MKCCEACGKDAEMTRRALILRGAGSAQPGNVCGDCAELGWLLVLGADWEDGQAAPDVRSTASAGRGAMLEKVGFGLRRKRNAKRDTPGRATDETIEPLPAGERRVLSAIAQHDKGVTRAQLTILTGYKKSTRDLYLQKLTAKGLIEHHTKLRDVLIVAVAKGIAWLGDDYDPLPRGRKLLAYWLEHLPRGERAILDTLTRDRMPVIIPRDSLTELTGYQKSTRDLYLQKLTARCLVSSTPNGIQAVPELFQ